MKLFMARVGGIQYRKIGDDKYKLLKPIYLLPTKKTLSKEELESIYRIFDTGFYIKDEKELKVIK